MRNRSIRFVLALPAFWLTTWLASSCGGSKGSSNPVPTNTVLIKAAFIGSSPSDPTPDPGEKLVLYFDGQVSLVNAAILDASDLALSSGSLGAALSAPSLLSSSAVQVFLGSGVSFTPGTTTVQLLAAQDAVLDSAGARVPQSSALTILSTDGVAPSIDSFTLSSIPSDLNGTGGAGGTLQVAESGFSIDASYSDAASVDPSSIVLKASVPVGTVPAGANLVPALNGTPGATSMSLTVPQTLPFPQGDVTLTLSLADATGMPSADKTFAFKSRILTDVLRPFETTQLWFLDLGRDIEALGSSTSDGGVTIGLSSSAGANGTSDFNEVLGIYGLRTASPIPNVSAGKDSNQVVLDLLKTRILAQVALLYPSVDVSFTFTSPGTFANGPRVLYGAGQFSQIAIAGASDLSGVLGLAFFDPHNTFQDDDSSVPPVTGSRLGVFPFSLAQGGAINSIGSHFRTVFDPILDHRGTPVGEKAGDDQLLRNLLGTPTSDPRENAIKRAIDSFGRVLAVIAAHECAHSMGLVQDSVPPAGLYGNVAFSGGTTSSGHIDLSKTSIFPSSAQEVMSPAISFQQADDPNTAFNALFLAYLRESVIYDNN
ncbi:MAG: hypothetical protein ACE5F1_00350 [Planctomycetota bacterium]